MIENYAIETPTTRFCRLFSKGSGHLRGLREPYSGGDLEDAVVRAPRSGVRIVSTRG
jgi:hypothetical protein